eukprot:gene15897-22031_t
MSLRQSQGQSQGQSRGHHGQGKAVTGGCTDAGRGSHEGRSRPGHLGNYDWALQQRLLDLQKKKKATQEGGAGSTSPPPPTAAAKQTSTPPPTVSSPPTTASTPPTTASHIFSTSAGGSWLGPGSLSAPESSAEADGPFDYAAEDNVMEPMGPKLERVEGVPL